MTKYQNPSVSVAQRDADASECYHRWLDLHAGPAWWGVDQCMAEKGYAVQK
jgi:hypothetical protein